MTWTRLASCSRQFRKEKVTINRPFRVELVKLRMLQFYYYCLDYFIDRRDFELMQMDTDNMYLGFSCKILEKPVRPELLEEFEVTKIFASHGINEAIARRAFSSWRSKEPVRSSSAVNVITWRTKRRAKPSCHRSAFPDMRQRSTEWRTKLQTRVQDGERHDANTFPR